MLLENSKYVVLRLRAIKDFCNSNTAFFSPCKAVSFSFNILNNSSFSCSMRLLSTESRVSCFSFSCNLALVLPNSFKMFLLLATSLKTFSSTSWRCRSRFSFKCCVAILSCRSLVKSSSACFKLLTATDRLWVHSSLFLTASLSLASISLFSSSTWRRDTPSSMICSLTVSERQKSSSTAFLVFTPCSNKKRIKLAEVRSIESGKRTEKSFLPNEKKKPS